MFDIREELKKLPEAPGVYLMHDAEGHILYVGKAVNLKNRVKQYFVKTVNRGPQILKMIREIAWFETITVDSETEALILECSLIKEHRPRYNTLLMDDKAYPYICLTHETYPRLRVARSLHRDGNEYFGPYTNVTAMRESLRLATELFALRSCERKLPETCGKERPCLNFELKRCLGPCRGCVSPELYGERVERARRFLKGDYRELRDELKSRMQRAAEQLEFEEAARLRDLIAQIRELSEKQKIEDTGGEDRDVLALAAKDGVGMAEIFFVRDGRVIGRDHFRLEVPVEQKKAEVLSELLKQFYSGTPYVPREILVETEPADREAIEQMLAAKNGRKTYIRVPQKGEKQGLLSLAAENALRVLQQDLDHVAREEEQTRGAQKELAALLGLDPERIRRLEAYDISHISGFATVGSMVVYQDGRPKNNEYRKFRIKWVEGVNDFASLAEVLYRRFSRGLQEKSSLREQGLEEEGFVHFPDLILMDGGLGQTEAAEAVLAELKLEIPVCGMVKDDRHRTRGLIFRGREIPIGERSGAFRLITRIQDEAHRFAIEYHRNLRGKAQIHSLLEDIPGIGPKRRAALMAHFGGLEPLKAASFDELAGVPGMDRPSAAQVYAFFHGGELPPREETATGSLELRSGAEMKLRCAKP